MAFPYQNEHPDSPFDLEIFGSALEYTQPPQTQRRSEPFPLEMHESVALGGPQISTRMLHPNRNLSPYPQHSMHGTHMPIYGASQSYEYSDPALSPFGTLSSQDTRSYTNFDDVTETTMDEGKRSKKLEKNRESARQCRRRKKVYIQSLEEKVNRLSGRIQDLQQEYWFTKEKLREEQRKVAIALEGLVHGKDTEKDCAVLLSRFSDICYKQGQSAILYHLEQVKELLIPAQQLKFILWGLDQHDEFYDMGSKTSGGTIWSMLSEELGWTDEQRERLVQYRDFIKVQNKELTSCIQKFDHLRDEICHRLDSLQRNMNEIRTLFTPQQQAKFVVWVEQNQAVMKMLNSVMALPRERPEDSQGQDRVETTPSDQSFSDLSSYSHAKSIGQHTPTLPTQTLLPQTQSSPHNRAIFQSHSTPAHASMNGHMNPFPGSMVGPPSELD
eukprot:TRINITY_DN3668_c0_g1_i1.p1 TRINITY_DN3668_c0_g1~~TRINITY_DN3668_c0_g1_i1.p1  ORF type:complete len:442 (-),score=89.75 TRINITY_DN3668_c0_g1_i1:145-1470(-)